ncbi:MAG: hypothetical protein PHD60_02595 [Clostridia bacterium]|nr:hypothetical protein [Clostridia bacterium]
MKLLDYVNKIVRQWQNKNLNSDKPEGELSEEDIKEKYFYELESEETFEETFEVDVPGEEYNDVGIINAESVLEEESEQGENSVMQDNNKIYNSKGENIFAETVERIDKIDRHFRFIEKVKNKNDQIIGFNDRKEQELAFLIAIDSSNFAKDVINDRYEFIKDKLCEKYKIDPTELTSKELKRCKEYETAVAALDKVHNEAIDRIDLNKVEVLRAIKESSEITFSANKERLISQLNDDYNYLVSDINKFNGISKVSEYLFLNKHSLSNKLKKPIKNIIFKLTNNPQNQKNIYKRQVKTNERHLKKYIEKWNKSSGNINDIKIVARKIAENHYEASRKAINNNYDIGIAITKIHNNNQKRIFPTSDGRLSLFKKFVEVKNSLQNNRNFAYNKTSENLDTVIAKIDHCDDVDEIKDALIKQLKQTEHIVNNTIDKNTKMANHMRYRGFSDTSTKDFINKEVGIPIISIQERRKQKQKEKEQKQKEEEECRKQKYEEEHRKQDFEEQKQSPLKEFERDLNGEPFLEESRTHSMTFPNGVTIKETKSTRWDVKVKEAREELGIGNPGNSDLRPNKSQHHRDDGR